MLAGSRNQQELGNQSYPVQVIHNGFIDLLEFLQQLPHLSWSMEAMNEWLLELHMQTVAASNSVSEEHVPKSQVIYRCKKCRRIVASEENIVPHEQGKGEQCFKWKKRNDIKNDQAECSSIFVESMKWMQSVQEGFVEEKLQCMGCKARLGSFNWAGLQCSCGAWVTPAFQLHKSRLDKCFI